jgi:hypothetical protein
VAAKTEQRLPGLVEQAPRLLLAAKLHLRRERHGERAQRERHDEQHEGELRAG